MEQRKTKKARRSANGANKIAQLDARAEELFNKEHFVSARRLYEKALALETKPNARAYFTGQIGICHFNTGNDREAIRFLRKSAQLFRLDEPEFMPDMYGFVHFHLGSLLEYQGKIAKALEARKVCERYVESQEKDTQWMLYSGMSRNLDSLGSHEEAIRYNQKAIEVLSDNDPGLAYLYESMATNHMKLKEYSEAIHHFTKVLEIDPEFERKDEVYLKVAHCYDQITNDRMALENYYKILEMKQLTERRENLTWLYLKLALAHFRLEQHEKSLLVTLEGLRRRPRNSQESAELRAFLTNNYSELGRHREAVAEGEKTLKLAKRFPNASLFYFRMALSYAKLGNKKNFTKFRALCRRLFPDDTWNNRLEKLA